MLQGLSERGSEQRGKQEADPPGPGWWSRCGLFTLSPGRDMNSGVGRRPLAAAWEQRRRLRQPPRRKIPVAGPGWWQELEVVGSWIRWHFNGGTVRIWWQDWMRI